LKIDTSRIDRIIDDENERWPFSGVVLVREKGETVFEKGYGLANRAESLPNSINTRFQMASGCKIFTARPSANWCKGD